MTPPKRRYVIRKFVMARSMTEAINLEKKKQVDEIWIDQDYKPPTKDDPKDVIGFHTT